MIWKGILEMLSDDVADVLGGYINPEKIARHLGNIRENFILPQNFAPKAVALGKKISLPIDLLRQIEEALEMVDRSDGEDFEGWLVISLQEMILVLGELKDLEAKDIEAALEGKFSMAKKLEHV